MTDLTDRMRTCAAYIRKRKEAGDHEMVASDAADLLIEAADALEPVSDPLGEPMALLEPLPPAPPPDFTIDRRQSIAWITGLDTLPPPVAASPSYRHPKVCPQCDSRATKRVVRDGNRVILSCPVCGTAWEYKP